MLNMGLCSTAGKFMADHASAASLLLGHVEVDLGITYGFLGLLLGVKVPPNNSRAAPGLSVLASAPKVVVHRCA